MRVRTCVCAHAHAHMHTCAQTSFTATPRSFTAIPRSLATLRVCLFDVPIEELPELDRREVRMHAHAHACMHMHTHACSCIHLTSSTRYLRCMHLRLRISCMIHLTSSTHYLRCTCMFAYVYPACVYAYMQARLRAARVSYVDDGCVSGHRLALGRSLTHTCTCACVHTCIHTFAGERRRAAVGRSL